MRTPRILIATALSAAVLALCACSVVSLAHGDPGRDTASSAQAPRPATSPAGSAAASPGVVSAAPPPAAVGPVSAVTVTFSDHVQQLAASDPRLTTDALAAALESELLAHQLYAPAQAGAHRTLAIKVDDFTSQLSSNATVFGFTFRSVMLIGTARVQGDGAAGTPSFEVHARASQSNRDPGAGAGSLAGLYTRFAVITVADLRGLEPPAEAVPR